MRVTHVITRLVVGGAQENTIATVLGLARKPDVDAHLISGPTTGPEGSLESSLPAAQPREGVSPILTIVPELVRPVHPWKDLLALRHLANFFRQRRPDIVHTHSGKAGVLGRLAAARAGVPVIVHTIHGPSFGPFQGALANFTFRGAERQAARVTTHFVAVAEAMKEQYLAAGIGQPKQYTKIFSGFDLAPYLSAKNDPQRRAQWGLKPDAIVIGKIARLFKLKGHDDLFAIAPELVRRCPRIQFLLVGDGPWRRRFEEKVCSAGLTQHVVFAGLVPPTELPGLVGIMDIVVHLSRREGLPRVLPQALAAARPVVAYDCDGAREVCFDNETGFLVGPGDLAGLADRLLRLTLDPNLRSQFGNRGRQFVREHFAVEKMVDDIYDLYLRLTAERGLPIK
jgi:glycosyltransferase involved in cell wall biosynthesis